MVDKDLETQDGAQQKADAAESAAESYADGEIENHRQNETHATAQPPETHGNESHDATFETEAGAQAKADDAEASAESYADGEIEDHRQNETHASAQPPETHGNEAHSDGFGLAASGYTEVTTDRDLDTPYQNTTGGPLEVSVIIQATGDGVFAVSQLKVGDTAAGVGSGAAAVADARDPNADGSWRATVRAIVPDGQYYEVSKGDTEIEIWREQELSVQ